jgi:hypothetical protein
LVPKLRRISLPSIRATCFERPALAKRTKGRHDQTSHSRDTRHAVFQFASNVTNLPFRKRAGTHNIHTI